MGRFHNDFSQVGFIGKYNSVDEVILSDEKELSDIDGSFDAIADRIRGVVDYCKNAEQSRQGFGKLKNPSYDNNIEILNFLYTKGFQECPFDECKKNWSLIIEIRNPLTLRELTINEGIEHLARDHHFLEKGNEYGISAKEFYYHFM